MRNIIEHISNKQVGLVYTKRPPLRLQSTQWNKYFYEIAFGFFILLKCFIHPIFWFLVTFDNEVMKIQKYYTIFDLFTFYKARWARQKKPEKNPRN